jgi:hypothetical protein
MKHMKRTEYIAAAVLLLLGAMTVHAQSLGDYARSTRQTKPTSQASANHHYDNDNLPREQQLSIVGNPSASAPAGQTADATQPANAAVPSAAANGNSASTSAALAKDPKDPKTAAEDRKKADEELQKKITAQKQKIDALSHELDITQREYKLRAASFYADAGARLRNAAQWDKDDTQYKQDIADKQKALDAARAELDAIQESARKAGIRQKDEQ